MVVCHNCAPVWCFRPFSILGEHAGSYVSSWSSKSQPGQHKVCWRFFVNLYHLVVDIWSNTHTHTPLRHMLYLQIKQDMFSGRYTAISLALQINWCNTYCCRLQCPSPELLHRVTGLALQCKSSHKTTTLFSPWIEFLLSCLQLKLATSQRRGVASLTSQTLSLYLSW